MKTPPLYELKELLEISKRIKDFAGNSISRAEFTQAFQVVVNAVKHIETGTRDFCDEALKTLSKKVDDKLAQVKNGTNGKDGYTPVKGVDYHDGTDGKDADEEAITKRIEKTLSALIPPPLDGEEIANRLEELPEAKKLEMSAVKGLLAELQKLRDIKTKQNSIISPRYVHTPMTDRFTGDGSTKVFYLGKQPKDLGKVKLHCRDFPYVLMNNDGFTISGKTLTIASDFDAPTNNFLVDYYI